MSFPQIGPFLTTAKVVPSINPYSLILHCLSSLDLLSNKVFRQHIIYVVISLFSAFLIMLQALFCSTYCCAWSRAWRCIDSEQIFIKWMKHFLLETLSFPSFLPMSSDIPSSLLSLGFLFLMKVAQSCPTLCDPMNYSVHGISQARILQWVVFLFSRGFSQPMDKTQVSCIAGRFSTSWTTREGLKSQT